MKKTLKLFTILSVCILLTGCTTPLKDNDNKAVVYEKTGQNLTENIICRPTDKEVIKLYEENGVDIDELPECSNLKIFDKYINLWNSVFIKPLAWIILKVGEIVKNNGLSVIIIGILIRLLLLPLTIKGMKQTENQKKAQPELKRIEKKYEGKTDNESLMKKSQETMAVYKKYDIKLASGCLTLFIQFPLFIGFYEAVNRVPAIFEQSLLGFQLGTTPLIGLKMGEFQYIIIPILILVTTYFSFKANKNNAIDESMQKQMNSMSTFFTIFMAIMSLSFSTAVALYWITSSTFTIIQNQFLKKKEV